MKVKKELVKKPPIETASWCYRGDQRASMCLLVFLSFCLSVFLSRSFCLCLFVLFLSSCLPVGVTDVTSKQASVFMKCFPFRQGGWCSPRLCLDHHQLQQEDQHGAQRGVHWVRQGIVSPLWPLLPISKRSLVFSHSPWHGPWMAALPLPKVTFLHLTWKNIWKTSPFQWKRLRGWGACVNFVGAGLKVSFSCWYYYQSFC